MIKTFTLVSALLLGSVAYTQEATPITAEVQQSSAPVPGTIYQCAPGTETLPAGTPVTYAGYDYTTIGDGTMLYPAQEEQDDPIIYEGEDAALYPIPDSYDVWDEGTVFNWGGSNWIVGRGGMHKYYNHPLFKSKPPHNPGPGKISVASAEKAAGLGGKNPRSLNRKIVPRDVYGDYGIEVFGAGVDMDNPTRSSPLDVGDYGPYGTHSPRQPGQQSQLSAGSTPLYQPRAPQGTFGFQSPGQSNSRPSFNLAGPSGVRQPQAQNMYRQPQAQAQYRQPQAQNMYRQPQAQAFRRQQQPRGIGGGGGFHTGGGGRR